MPRGERKARNVALSWEVNERIAEIAAGFADSPEQLQDFICECSQSGCGHFVLAPLSAYALVREDASTFLVLPGHEDAQDEEVLVRFPNFLIVRSRSVAAAIAPAAVPPPAVAER